MNTEDTEKLNDALADMRDKSRVLNDSLKTLGSDGFDKLSSTVVKAAQQLRGATQKPASDIVESEMMKLLRREVGTLFGGIARQSGGGGSGGGINVIINNNAGALVTARETTGLFNQKQLEITIDQMVAQALVNGRQTGGVMRTLFGLAPGLLGR